MVSTLFLIIIIPPAYSSSTYELQSNDTNKNCEAIDGTWSGSTCTLGTTFILLQNDSLTTDAGVTLKIMNGGDLINDGRIDNTGSFEIVSGGDLDNSGTVDNAGALYNAGGAITHDFPSAAFINTGTLTNAGITAISGMPSSDIDLGSISTMYGSGKTIYLHNNLSIEPGTALTIPSGYTLKIVSGGDLDNSGTVDNAGTIYNAGGAMTHNSFASFINTGTVYGDLSDKQRDELYERGKSLLSTEDYDKALSDFDKILQFYPNDTQTLNEEGFIADQFFKYHRYADIERILNYIILQHLGDMKSWRELGAAEYDNGDYSLAQSTFSDVLNTEPDDVYDLDMEGNAFNKLGNYANATQVFEHVLKLNNADATAFSGLGFALFNQGLYKEAIQQYENAYGNLRPNFYGNPRAHFDDSEMLAMTESEAEAIEKIKDPEMLAQKGTELQNELRLAGQHYAPVVLESALIYYDHYLEFNPKNAMNVTVLEEKAITANRLNLPLITLSTSSAILDIQPENVLALRLEADSLLTLHRDDEANQYYDKILEIDPYNILALIGKGNVFMDKGLYDRAIDEYQNVMNLVSPSDYSQEKQQMIYAELGMAKAYLFLQEFDKAENQLYLIADDYDYSVGAEINYTMGNYFYDKNEFENATTWYGTVIDFYSNGYYFPPQAYADSLNGMAAALFQQGKYADSADYSKWAVGNSTGVSEIDVYLANEAKALNKLNNFTAAKSVAEQALEVNTNNTAALIEDGNAFFGLQSYDPAIHWYSRALENDPFNAEALLGKGDALLEEGSYEDSRSALNAANDSLSLLTKINSAGLNPEDADYLSQVNTKLEKVNNKIFWKQIVDVQIPIIATIIGTAGTIIPLLHRRRKQLIEKQKLVSR